MKGPQHRERWAVLYLSNKAVKIRLGNKIAFPENENVKALWVNLVEFNYCYICDKPCFEMD